MILIIITKCLRDKKKKKSSYQRRLVIDSVLSCRGPVDTRHYDVKTTSRRRFDVATSFWRHNDVIIVPCALIGIWQIGVDLKTVATGEVFCLTQWRYMSTMASKITKDINYWLFVRGNQGWSVDSLHKGSVMRKAVPHHDTWIYSPINMP